MLKLLADEVLEAASSRVQPQTGCDSLQASVRKLRTHRSADANSNIYYHVMTMGISEASPATWRKDVPGEPRCSDRTAAALPI